MNYAQTIEFLDSAMSSFQQAGAAAYKPGLERITEFCRRTGNPQRNFFTIHVAGTDGKGSVSSMIAAVLQSAGYRTGLFTSPHLHEFRERIRVDGEIIPKQKVVNFVDKYRDTMLEVGLSYFEMTTAMAFDYFDQSDVEVAVIETGLGGRLDATNIITPILSIITNISLEHTDLLGDTAEKIAAEKAGIIKKSIPVLIGQSSEAYNSVIEARAAEMKSKVVYAEKEFLLEKRLPTETGSRYILVRNRDNRKFDLRIDLEGDYQSRNIVTATAALDFLHEETPLSISRRALREGLLTAAAATGLRGRWTVVSSDPLTVCDTGHTAEAFSCISKQLNALGRKVIAVIGFVSDKRTADILNELEKVEALYEVIFTRPSVGRAMSLDRLREAAAGRAFAAKYIDTVAEAVAEAKKDALEAGAGMIFVGGSTYIAAEMLKQ